MSKHKYSFTGDIEWNKFSQSELRKTAKKAGYQLSEDGNCFGICMSLVLYEQKHRGDTARESYLAKLNKKIEFPENNKKFYDKILLAQTQYQVNIPIKKHLISLDKILAPEPFISILPDELQNNEFIIFGLVNGESGHTTIIHVVQREGDEVKYRFFDPNLGLTEELSEEMLRTILKNVLGIFYNNRNAIHLGDPMQIASKIYEHKKSGSLKANYLHHATSSLTTNYELSFDAWG